PAAHPRLTPSDLTVAGRVVVDDESGFPSLRPLAPLNHSLIPSSPLFHRSSQSVQTKSVHRSPAGSIESRLVYIDRPILRIPSLAIHLVRTLNEASMFNNVTLFLPILETAVKSSLRLRAHPSLTP